MISSLSPLFYGLPGPPSPTLDDSWMDTDTTYPAEEGLPSPDADPWGDLPDLISFDSLSTYDPETGLTTPLESNKAVSTTLSNYDTPTTPTERSTVEERPHSTATSDLQASTPKSALREATALKLPHPMTLRPRLTTSTTSTTSGNAKRALGTKKTKNNTNSNKRLKTSPKNDLTAPTSTETGMYASLYMCSLNLNSSISVSRAFVASSPVSQTTTKTTTFPKWILDCGSTRHLSSTRPNNAVCLSKTIPISVAGGGLVYAEYSGSVTLHCPPPNGMSVLTLSDVLWIPKLEFCLLSVSLLTRLGATLHYDGLRARIYGVPTSQRRGHSVLSKSRSPEAASPAGKVRKLIGTLKMACTF